ncbi:hypothetical protein, partial [Acinetobacter baumannii]|uniref:hypothetical protein n=1 Tax=Acinetobacter baumannii TaxID=470 RepID=UPI001C07949E
MEILLLYIYIHINIDFYRFSQLFSLLSFKYFVTHVYYNFVQKIKPGEQQTPNKIVTEKRYSN